MKGHIKIGALGLAIIASPINTSIAMEVHGENSPTHPIELPDINGNVVMSLKGLEAGRVALKLSSINTTLFYLMSDEHLWKSLNSKEKISESHLPSKINFFDFYLPIKVRLSMTCNKQSSFRSGIPVLIKTSNRKCFRKEIDAGRNDLLPTNELFSFGRKDTPLTFKCCTAYHFENLNWNGKYEVVPTEDFTIFSNDLQDTLGHPLVSIRLFYSNISTAVNPTSRFKMSLNYDRK